MRPAKLNRPDADRTTRPRGEGELLLAGCVVSYRCTRARAGETRRRAPQPGAAQRRTRARAGETGAMEYTTYLLGSRTRARAGETDRLARQLR